MKKGGEIMDRVMDRINELNISPQMAKEIGLSKDWKKEISPKEVKSIINTANKLKTALRKLSRD